MTHTVRSCSPFRLLLAALALGLVGCLAACSDGASEAATTTTDASSTTSSTSTTFIPPSIPAADRQAVCDADQRIQDADIEISALLGPALDAEESPDADALLLSQLPKTAEVAGRAGAAYDELARLLPAGLSTDAQALGDLTREIYGEVSVARSIDEVIVVIEIAQKEYARSLDAAQRVSDTLRATCGAYTPTATTAGVAATTTATR